MEEKEIITKIEEIKNFPSGVLFGRQKINLLKKRLIEATDLENKKFIEIGDYVLTGGEIPAMVLTDSIVRLIPGVLVKEGATELESFSLNMGLEHPHYTRPEIFNGWKVPSVLLSGDHKKINIWRQGHKI